MCHLLCTIITQGVPADGTDCDGTSCGGTRSGVVSDIAVQKVHSYM